MTEQQAKDRIVEIAKRLVQIAEDDDCVLDDVGNHFRGEFGMLEDAVKALKRATP